MFVDDRQVDFVLDSAAWGALAQQALVHEGVAPNAEMGLAFVSVDEMTSLNEDHMAGTGPTDVLAFPIDEVALVTPAVEADDDRPPAMAGDVIICPAVAAKATNTGRGLDDEVALLVVHGVLHLLGHDHAEPDERELMQSREQVLLERFHPTGTR